jgi:hypothetical protein
MLILCRCSTLIKNAQVYRAHRAGSISAAATHVTAYTSGAAVRSGHFEDESQGAARTHPQITAYRRGAQPVHVDPTG